MLGRSRPNSAIDPMALFLSHEAYLMWIEKNDPHVPKEAEILEIVKSMNGKQRKEAMETVKSMMAIAKSFEKALSTQH